MCQDPIEHPNALSSLTRQQNSRGPCTAWAAGFLGRVSRLVPLT